MKWDTRHLEPTANIVERMMYVECIDSTAGTRFTKRTVTPTTAAARESLPITVVSTTSLVTLYKDELETGIQQ